jgi:hypothetical protein
MKSTVRRGKRLASHFLLLLAVMIAFASMAQSAEKPVDSADRESLRGVTGVEVVVEPLAIEIEQFGLHTETLQRDIKQRLHKAGVKVLMERERLATSDGALLTIRMDAVHDRISRYFYSIDLFVSRKVQLESQPDSELSAVTQRLSGREPSAPQERIHSSSRIPGCYRCKEDRP